MGFQDEMMTLLFESIEYPLKWRASKDRQKLYLTDTRDKAPLGFIKFQRNGYYSAHCVREKYQHHSLYVTGHWLIRKVRETRLDRKIEWDRDHSYERLYG